VCLPICDQFAHKYGLDVILLPINDLILRIHLVHLVVRLRVGRRSSVINQKFIKIFGDGLMIFRKLPQTGVSLNTINLSTPPKVTVLMVTGIF
jgi:hypothetical protein